MSLDGKCVLVTGASGGIGSEVVKRFLEAGAIVGIHYCTNEKAAAELVALARGEQCKAFQADFSDSHQILRLWEDFFAWSGTIDILVNNAGGASDARPFEELSEAAWDRTFQLNVKAPFLLSRAAMPIMKDKSFGRIINLSSIGVKFGGGQTTLHYSASKAALEAITHSLAKVGAPNNVLVNVIRVGVTDTQFHDKIGITSLSDRVALIPLRRLAQPEEIADAVIFLSSQASSYIAGSVLTVAGGE